MPESEKLLACPFCGGKAHLLNRSTTPANPLWTVDCKADNNCLADVHSGFKPTPEYAIAAWNTRAADPRGDDVNDMREQRDNWIMEETKRSREAAGLYKCLKDLMQFLTTRFPDAAIYPAAMLNADEAIRNYEHDHVPVCEYCNGIGETGPDQTCWHCKGSGAGNNKQRDELLREAVTLLGLAADELEDGPPILVGRIATFRARARALGVEVKNA